MECQKISLKMSMDDNSYQRIILKKVRAKTVQFIEHEMMLD